MIDIGWARIKRKQANEADSLAAVASGIGEYGIANACYRLAGLLRRQAAEIEAEHRARLPKAPVPGAAREIVCPPSPGARPPGAALFHAAVVLSCPVLLEVQLQGEVPVLMPVYELVLRFEAGDDSQALEFAAGVEKTVKAEDVMTPMSWVQQKCAVERMTRILTILEFLERFGC